MSSLPKVFIGSSSEGLAVAREVELQLYRDVDTTIWKDGIFELGRGALESLIDSLDNFDFAIMILTTDDRLESRDDMYLAPRDNVLFELGLFMGRIGRLRTFIIHEEGVSIKLPTDLDGITVSKYRKKNNISSALSPICTKILKAINKHGLFERRPKYVFEKSGIVNIFVDRQDKDLFETLNKQRSKVHSLLYLSISGRQIFDSNFGHPCREMIANPDVNVDILLLNPYSDSGPIMHRCKYEKGDASKDDIERCLFMYLPKLLRARLDAWASKSEKANNQLQQFLSGQENCRKLTTYNTFSVRLYNEMPVIHLLSLDEKLFVEQYHLPNMGEPEMKEIAIRFDCIGRHVPMLQYDEKSLAAQFYLSHFRRLKSEPETVDYTERLYKHVANNAKDDTLG